MRIYRIDDSAASPHGVGADAREASVDPGAGVGPAGTVGESHNVVVERPWIRSQDRG